jgi:hypothetical protein
LAATGALATSLKDTGMGIGTANIAITLSGQASATYQSYNKAGNKPEEATGLPTLTGRAAFPAAAEPPSIACTPITPPPGVRSHPVRSGSNMSAATVL